MQDIFRKETVQWFSSCVGTPTQAQTLAFSAISKGYDTLISSPTGSGKTLAAFLYFLDGFAKRNAEGTLSNECEIIYISPLKALGNDIQKNLARPIEGLGLKNIVRTAIRTGDTTPSERQAMIRKPPHILITTPESFYLLLSSTSGQKLLKTAKHIILDEFHATISAKRGVHMMLSLARLDALCEKRLQRIALSATITPLETASNILSCGHKCEIVAPEFEKKTSVTVDTAVPDMRILHFNSIWPHLADRVTEALHDSRCVLAFSDGRASCERLAAKINEQEGEIIARTHHGCVSKEQRLQAEQDLKNGTLRVMAATSSMELGIDVGDIDMVIQIGNPLSVASLMQRLGRAGHSPGRVSRMQVYPKTAQDTLMCALTVKAAMDKKIEPILEIEKPMDLLCQHLVSMAATGAYSVKEATSILKKAWAYRNLSEEEVRKALSMLYGDYEHALDHPVRARVLYDRIHDTFSGDKYTSLLALSSGGTIPDRGWYAVLLRDGTRLGELDEEYVFEARLGDKFILGAFPWVIVDITRDAVIVDKTTSAGAQSPFWKGDSSMRSYETGAYFGKLLGGIKASAEKGRFETALRFEEMNLTRSAALTAARVVMEEVGALGTLPTDTEIILEHFPDEANEHQMMVHSVFGGRVNRALGMLLAREAMLLSGVDAHAYDDDDGILIYMLGGTEVPGGLFSRIHSEDAERIISETLPSTPMFSIVFRQNVQRAMLMGARSGRRLPLWIQRLRASQALTDALKSKDHPMIRETVRECMNYHLDLKALKQVLDGIHSGKITVREVYTDEPSPMCLNLRRQAEAELMYETVIPSIAKEPQKEETLTLSPEEDALNESYRAVRLPENSEETHSFLMTTGDLMAGEEEIPLEYLEALCMDGRAVYIEPGLWIAKEQEAQYESALLYENADALKRIVRRVSRYRGAIDEDAVMQRYGIARALAANILSSLSESGEIVLFESRYVHKDVYELAQRKTISILRKRVETAPQNVYASHLLSRIQPMKSADEQIRSAIAFLSGEPIPKDALESVLLPARVSKYRPQMLDQALARGECQYALDPENGSVVFTLPEDETDEFIDIPDHLSGAERFIASRLLSRGASFARSFTYVDADESTGDAILSLLKKGLVHSDSFAPVRYLGQTNPKNKKAGVRQRVAAVDSGRWELVKKQRQKTVQDHLNRIFDRYMIVSRETSAGYSWTELLSELRRMEYQGKVRRGYFVSGISGAQFVRESDFEKVSYLLKSPNDQYVIASAADPSQPYGKILPHMEGRAFTRVLSTYVVFYSGTPVCAFEKNGESIRVFDFSHMDESIALFEKSFKSGKILPSLKRVTVKQFPEEITQTLLAHGFQPDALFMTLFKF